MNHITPARFAALRDAIHASSFAPQPSSSHTVGVEVELLAHDADTNRPMPLLRGVRGLIPTIRRFAQRKGWTEFTAYDGTTRFDIPGRALISFEPGGQIEISSVPSISVTQLVAGVHDVVTSLRDALSDEGVMLRSIGIDPFNDANDIPLQLQVDRYRQMTDYFESIGPFGIRMMRQTAAIQVSIDRGNDPASRWRLLNDLAPYLIAIFANSPTYFGHDTGHQSFRAHCWRRLDPSRTGIAKPSDDPAAAYTRFALDANDMMRVDERTAGVPVYRSAEYWLAHEDDRADSWASHLTTLFPEVRARGHFEVRSCDAIAPEWYAAPIVFVAGLAYDERSSREASLLAAESSVLLRAAGERGLRDVGIARTARDLFQLALEGAARLGPTYVSPDVLETAAKYYETYTARERTPADDVAAGESTPPPRATIRSPI